MLPLWSRAFSTAVVLFTCLQPAVGGSLDDELPQERLGSTFVLTVIKEGDGDGTVSGGGIDCGPGCPMQSVSVLDGTSVTLTGSGEQFLGFAGETCFGTGPCTFGMFRDKTVYAGFALPESFGVLFSSPSNADTGVSPSTPPTLFFNRPVALGPNVDAITFTDGEGNPVPFTATVNNTALFRRLVLVVGQPLASGTTYEVVVAEGAAQDEQGEPLATPFGFTFTTVVEGAPKMYLTAYPGKVMEGSRTQVGIWFETPSSEDREIALSSSPTGILSHPSFVLLPAGEVLAELQVDALINHGSVSDAVATLQASDTSSGTPVTVSLPITAVNYTALTGPYLMWGAAGVIDDDDGDGVLESGEFGEILFEVLNMGPSDILNVNLTFQVANTSKLSILGGDPTCELGLIRRGTGDSCSKHVRADAKIPTGDYFIKVVGTSSQNGILDYARIPVVNNSQPDYRLDVGAFPSSEQPPGGTVEMRYTARNAGNGFDIRMPIFEVFLELEGQEQLLYRTVANARGDSFVEQTFRLPLVVPEVPGAHPIRARINPAGPGRIPESNVGNNEASVLTLRVAAPNRPPALDPLAETYFVNAGSTLSFTVGASDPDGDALTFSLGPGAPIGMSLHPTSGLLQWTPACDQGLQTHDVEVRVADPDGLSDSQILSVVVGLEADLAVTKSSSTDIAVAGEEVGFTIEVANLGPSCVNGAALTDLLTGDFVDVSWTCSASAGSACAPGQVGDIADSTLSLLAGGTATYLVDARIVDSAHGSVANLAVATAPGGTDPNGTNDEASVTIALRELDFGDAGDGALDPAWSYPVRLADDGARHGAVADLRLGSAIDGEVDAAPSSGAAGDDEAGVDDEDGVTFLSGLIPCEALELEIASSGPGLLSAWIDFHRDGAWTEAQDQIFIDETLVNGTNARTFVVPCDAIAGSTFARFRLSSEGGLGPGGLALDGEVEDYAVAVQPILRTLSVTISGGEGTVTSDPPGIDCGSACSVDLPLGSLVTLTAVAQVGYSFGGWSWASCGTGPTCMFSLDDSTNVDAQFAVACVDSLEGGVGNWAVEAGPMDGGSSSPWSLVADDSHSPVHAWFASDEDQVKDQVLRTLYPAAPAIGSHLRFWHRFATENGFDGGVLEVSIDGGGTWFDLLEGDGAEVPPNPGRWIVGGYDSVLNGCCSNPLALRDAWSGDSGGWVEVRADLSDFAGLPLELRWRFGAGVGGAGIGWWIDDVAVSAEACPLRVLFEDGFESGDTSRWSDAVSPLGP